MKIYLIFLFSLCLVLESDARALDALNYDAQNAKATLIVIATPIKVTETSELIALPGYKGYYNGTNEDVMLKGFETSFAVVTVLKGERNTETLVLHHYRLAKPWNMADGPYLVSFEPKEKRQFLMFLQKEADGRYVAVCGQTDPAFSISEIGGTSGSGGNPLPLRLLFLNSEEK